MTLTKEFDLNAWYPDICKILRSKFSLGVDAEDVIHEFCIALLHKQEEGSGSKYDPSRSSPSRYIMLVFDSFFKNRWRSQTNLRRESSLEEMLEDAKFDLRRAESIGNDPRNFFNMKMELDRFESWIINNDPSLTPYLQLYRQGYNANQIAENLKLSVSGIKVRFERAVDRFKTAILAVSGAEDLFAGKTEIGKVGFKLDSLLQLPCLESEHLQMQHV